MSFRRSIVLGVAILLALFVILPPLFARFADAAFVIEVDNKEGWYHHTWEMLYYLLAGIGAPAAIFAIFTAYQQTQKQIKKDVFLKSAEFVIDDLHARVVEIAYWWAHTSWKEYAGRFVSSATYIPGHQNKTTLVIHTSNALRKKGKMPPQYLSASFASQEIKPDVDKDIKEHAERYIEKFNFLIKSAEDIDRDLMKIYQESVLYDLAETLKTILAPQEKTNSYNPR